MGVVKLMRLTPILDLVPKACYLNTVANSGSFIFALRCTISKNAQICARKLNDGPNREFRPTYRLLTF